MGLFINIYDFKVKAGEKGYVTRRRSAEDERDLIVTITDSGEALKEKAVTIPERLGACVALEAEKAQTLYTLLYEVIGKGNDGDSSAVSLCHILLGELEKPASVFAGDDILQAKRLTNVAVYLELLQGKGSHRVCFSLDYFE